VGHVVGDDRVVREAPGDVAFGECGDVPEGSQAQALGGVTGRCSCRSPRPVRGCRASSTWWWSVPVWADLVIELDSTNKARSVDKLRFAQRAGGVPIWVRWRRAPVRGVPGAHVIDLTDCCQ
jgi:hypothetical protein